MNLITKVRTQGLVVKMVVILVEEEKMREMLVVDRSPSPTLPKGREFHIKPHSNPPKAPPRPSPKGRETIPAVF